MSKGEHAKRQTANASKKAAAIASHGARVATARAVFFAGVAPAGASNDGGGSAEAGSSAGCSGASGSTPSSAHDGRGSDDAGIASQPQACESPGEFDEPADARVSGRLDVRPDPVDAELDEDNEDDAPDDLGEAQSTQRAGGVFYYTCTCCGGADHDASTCRYAVVCRYDDRWRICNRRGATDRSGWYKSIHWWTCKRPR